MEDKYLSSYAFSMTIVIMIFANLSSAIQCEINISNVNLILIALQRG